MARKMDEKVYTDGDRSYMGGVVSTRAIEKLVGKMDSDSSQFAKAQNGYPGLSGNVVKRRGFEQQGATFGSAIRATRRFATEDGTQAATLVWEGQNVWMMTEAGVKTGLALDSFDYSGTLCTEEWADAVYFSDGVNGLAKVFQATVAQAAYAFLGDYDAAYAGSGDVDIAGTAGNDYSLEILDPGAVSQALSVSLSVKKVTVNLETDAAGDVVSTEAEVVNALNGDGGISAVTTWSGASANVVAARAELPFASGADIGDLWVDYPSAVNFQYLSKRTASERLFGIDADDPGDVSWCDSFDDTTWTGNGSPFSPGGAFTSLLEIGRVMLLTQSDKMFRIDGTDPTTWTAVSVGAEGVGCVLPFSLKEVEGVGVYYSPRGLAYFDGAKARPLAESVFDAMNEDNSLLPSDPDLYEGGFAVTTKDFTMMFYKSTSAKDGCDRAMVYNFRKNMYGGPYHLGFEATCGYHDLDTADDAGELHLGTHDGEIVRQYDGYQDLAAAFTFIMRSRGFPFGTATLDKVYRAARVGFYASASATTAVRFLCEDEASVRTNASRNFSSTGETEDVHVFGLPAGLRAKFGYLEVQNADNVAFEVTEEQVDAFFCRTR